MPELDAWAGRIGDFYVNCEVDSTQSAQWSARVRFLRLSPSAGQFCNEQSHCFHSTFSERYEALEVAKAYARDVIVRNAVSDPIDEANIKRVRLHAFVPL